MSLSSAGGRAERLELRRPRRSRRARRPAPRSPARQEPASPPRRRAGARRGCRRSRPGSCRPWAGRRDRAADDSAPPGVASRSNDPGRGRRRIEPHRALGRASASSAGPKAAGRAAATSLPRCAASSGASLRRSMNSSTPPSACRIAKASGSGVCGTSPPRMLSSQAIEFGHRQHRGVDSRPRRAPRRSRRASRPTLSPAKLGRMRHDRRERRGRLVRPRPQSSGLSSTGSARAGALGRRPQPLDRRAAVCSHGS